jgi:hypothetical protein
MHRVFRTGSAVTPASTTTSAEFDRLRDFVRGLGFVEEALDGGYIYSCTGTGGSMRRFMTLHGGRSHATVYLYPDALGRPPGHATAFYLALDAAGFDLGSKLGPSIGFDLTDETRVRFFREELARIVRE